MRVDGNIITKSNNLIEARYKLSLEEQRIILYLVSMIQPTDEDFKKYTIFVKDFVQLIDVKGKAVYRQIIDICEKLASKTLKIKKDSSILVIGWLSSAEYFEGKGKIELSFDPKLKPYLIKLKSNFTSYKLKNVIKLKSFYSIRIYELLKQYEKLQERTLTIVQLREYLGVDGDSYPYYANFKQKVLKIAQKELREKSDLFFDFDEIKSGRKVNQIKFHIFKNKEIVEGNRFDIVAQDFVIINNEQQMEEIKKMKKIISENILNDELLSILDAADGDFEKIAVCYNYARNKRNLKNFVGFMIWACKKTTDEIKMSGPKLFFDSKFQNYDKRNWDFDKIETIAKEQLRKND